MFSVLFMFFACSSDGTPQEASQKPAVKEQKAANPKPKAVDNKAAEAEANSKYTDFGSPFKLTQTMPAADFLASPEKFVDKTVRVEGKVTAVCQKMGCWLVITDNEKSMRITTKGHKFLVDKEGTGSICHVEGKVISRDKSPARTAHFESETSKGAPVPEKQAKGDKVIEIVASSVRLFTKK